MNEGPSFDVAIAGGGIVGAACALACAERGMHVLLVERDTFGSGATAAGMGHVVVMDDSDAQFALTRYSQRLWQQLAVKMPSTVEYEQRGTLWVAADGEELAAAEQKHAWYSARGVACAMLDQAQMREAEPHLKAGMAGGLLVHEDAVIYPPSAAWWMANEAKKLGAVLVRNQVAAISPHRLRLADGSGFSASFVVAALGAETAQLIPGLPVRPRKGHLVITDRYPELVKHQLVELGYLKSAHSSTGESVAFNIQPRSTGQLLIGSSRQYGTVHSGVDAHIVQAMLSRAAGYMPCIAQLSAIRTWTGFRAATPDKLPLIGPYEKGSSILLATGHEGLGITTSLATAQLIADHIQGRTSAIDGTPYLPSRPNLNNATNQQGTL